MATLQEIIDMAKIGELQSLAVKNNTDAIITFINLGLLELYKRFPIQTSEYVVSLVDGVEEYEMPSDLMYIVSAYGEVKEDSSDIVNVLPINSEDDPLSINTIGWNKIQVPLSVDGAYISIIYVAAPSTFTSADLATTIPLPPQMIEALLHYIGYRGHSAVDGEINAENSTHYTRFDASCARIDKLGIFNSDDLDMTDRLYNRGFM